VELYLHTPYAFKTRKGGDIISNRTERFGTVINTRILCGFTYNKTRFP